MEKLLTQLIGKLQKAYGARLVSVVLYGSAAAGDHHADFSDINILCVLSEISPRELAAGEDIFRWWREQGSPSPLLLTEHELVTSTDCFAIEFHDIQRQHRLLHGRDVITSLAIDDSFYRAQVEHDLRAKFLRVRQKAGGMLSNPDLLRRMLLDSVSTFCVLFRHALILSGVDAPALKRDVIQRAREVFGFDAAPFEKLLDVREGRLKPRELDPVLLLASYLKEIAQVIDAVDKIEKQGELS
ncbi:MAG: nucleotidyltransferase domain-containing protein [Candidatus Solibacter sp.]|nr:nucleotidyltransferase domain-containing protein [Candidatus Solibacter sp.]